MIENNRGVIKREVGKIELRGFEISNIITTSLIEKGYELISKPILNDAQYQIGEEITIYRIE